MVGLRIPQQQSIVKPRSHCTHCQHTLGALELIPVLSYIILRGKCRVCTAKISPIYAVIELTTGMLFLFSFWKLGISYELLVAWTFISLLVIIVVTDLAYMLIPNKILLFFLPLLVILRLLSPLQPWGDSALGAVLGFSILLLIAIVSKGGMGGGDVKLFFLIGLVLGTINTLLTLFIAAFIGMIVGKLIIMVSQQGDKTPIPFGPYIAVASIIVYFYGGDLVSWYLNLL